MTQSLSSPPKQQPKQTETVSVDETLARLRKGQQWLTERNNEINALHYEFATQMERWVAMELSLRNSGFTGCIRGSDGPCPTEDVAVRCLACANPEPQQGALLPAAVAQEGR